MTLIIDEMGGGDLIPFRGYEYWTGYPDIGLESSKYNHKIEHYIIDMYQAWTESPHLEKRHKKGEYYACHHRKSPRGSAENP